MTDVPAVIYLKPHNPDDKDIDVIKDENKVSDCSIIKTKEELKHSKLLKQPEKRKMKEENYDFVKKILIEFDQEISKRLGHVEEKLDNLSSNWDLLTDKVDQISTIVDKQIKSDRSSVSLQNGNCEDNSGPSIPITSGVTYITLNSEGDFPNGSWLGFEKNPEQRVRCRVTPTELFHINTTCKTPEKMALSLLDLLFDRETQACSNISGAGKHKKKQLDPLFIYGIKCHLMCHFNVTDQDWNKLKQNIDSKCRSAFHRKAKGLPLSSKCPQASPSEDEVSLGEPSALPDFSTESSLGHYPTDEIHDSELSFQEYNSTLGSSGIEGAIREAQQPSSYQDLEKLCTTVSASSQLICTDGNFEILQATPEQVAHIQQTHQVQILSGGQILATPIDEDDRHNFSSVTTELSAGRNDMGS